MPAFESGRSGNVALVGVGGAGCWSVMLALALALALALLPSSPSGRGGDGGCSDNADDDAGGSSAAAARAAPTGSVGGVDARKVWMQDAKPCQLCAARTFLNPSWALRASRSRAPRDAFVHSFAIQMRKGEREER